MVWLYSFLPFLIIGVGICLALFAGGMLVFKQTVARHKKSERYTISDFYPDGAVEAEFNRYNPVTFKCKTKRGYRLVCTLLRAREGNDRVAVLIHGLYSNRFEHAPQALEYLKRGFDVFLYNQRATGGSGGRCNTYGYYERDDLDSVTELLQERYGYTEIGVHGFSMGAATAAMHAALNEEKKRVSYYILDSPFSSMYDELLFIARRGPLAKPRKQEAKLPFHFMLRLGNFMNRIFLGFWYTDVQPREAVRKCSVPMFIIHGKEDLTCPVEMGEELYDCKVVGMRRIWEPEGSRHIRSYADRPEEYAERVFKFIRDAEAERTTAG